MFTTKKSVSLSQFHTWLMLEWILFHHKLTYMYRLSVFTSLCFSCISVFTFSFFFSSLFFFLEGCKTAPSHSPTIEEGGRGETAAVGGSESHPHLEPTTCGPDSTSSASHSVGKDDEVCLSDIHVCVNNTHVHYFIVQSHLSSKRCAVP